MVEQYIPHGNKLIQPPTKNRLNANIVTSGFESNFEDGFERTRRVIAGKTKHGF
jgi:hypothetical protein